MPNGYRVTLGDGVLGVGDSISDPFVFFTDQTNLGAGQWTVTGTLGGGPFGPATEPGTYFLATDGFVYFVPSLGPISSISSSSVISSPTYADAPTDNQVDGTAGADVIDETYSDAQGDSVDDGSGFGAGGLGDFILGGAGDDTIDGGAGNDSIQAGADDDVVTGGLGSDTIDGGSGNDNLDGGGATPVTSASESLNWSAQGGDEQDISTGFTQDTGTMQVTVDIRDDGNLTEASVETSATQYTDTGDPFDTSSAVQVSGTGLGATSTVELIFDPDTNSGMSDEVENVQFRINDVDTGGWQDQVTVVAFDADGNEVTVVLTAAGNDVVTGNSVVAGAGGDSSSEAAGSVLVEIAGPVHRIEIQYSNLDTAGQTIFYTDVHFDTVPELDGADTLIGGTGDDTLTLGNLDLGQGGDGDDLFLIDAAQLDGGVITVVGGEGDETTGDTLDLSGVLNPGSIVYTNTDDAAGGLSGTAELTDGTIVTFSEIENIICFTAGTLIQTPMGERRIETLQAGDTVLTLDCGPQPIRWIGKKTVRASGALAPIRFTRGAIGNRRDLLVSPQHRMLCTGYRTQLHFGESEVLAPAKSLVDDCNVTIEYGGMVTYVHMLFDQHQIVIANGAPSESFFPGGTGLDAVEDAARHELFKLFPELRSDLGSYGPASRICVKPHEARALLMA